MQIGPTRRARVARSVRFYLKPLGVGRMRKRDGMNRLDEDKTR